MIVDIDRMIETTGINDSELLKGFVRDFFHICSKEIEKIPASIEKGDNDAIIRYSHNIRGAAYRLQLEEIRLAAASLEKAAKNMETAEYDKLLKELETVFYTGSEEYQKIAS